MRRGPIFWRQLEEPSFISSSGEEESYSVLASVSHCYPEPSGTSPTSYSPIRRALHRRPPEGCCLLPALDLHVLGTPLAFVLSQDQTLHRIRIPTLLVPVLVTTENTVMS